MKGINTTRVKPTPSGHEKCYVLISTVNTNGSSRGISLFFNFVLEGRRMQILNFDKAHLKSEPLRIILRPVLAVNETFLLLVMFNKVAPHFAHLQ